MFSNGATSNNVSTSTRTSTSTSSNFSPSSYLVKQGWSGPGTALKKGGLKKPVTVAHKTNLKGLGRERDTGYAWWDDVFSMVANKSKKGATEGVSGGPNETDLIDRELMPDLAAGQRTKKDQHWHLFVSSTERRYLGSVYAQCCTYRCRYPLPYRYHRTSQARSCPTRVLQQVPARKAPGWHCGQ